MSMTLKVASHFDEIGSEPTPTRWLSDVEMVTRVRHVAEGEDPHIDGAIIADLRVSSDMPSTLISVASPGPTLTYYLVEKAWLLSETGSTLERIAPY